MEHVMTENPEGLRCDGSHACPAPRHIFGCFRSTLADEVEDHPNWQETPEGLVLTAAQEYAAAVVALEAGERYSVTRVNKAQSALLEAARYITDKEET
jgi:hypothetical protein